MEPKPIEFDADQKQENKIFYVLTILSEYKFDFCLGSILTNFTFFSSENGEFSIQLFASKVEQGQTLNKSISSELKKYFGVESFELIPPIFENGFGSDKNGKQIRRIAVNVQIPFSKELVERNVMGLNSQWSAFISSNIILELTEAVKLIKSCNDNARLQIPSYTAPLLYSGSEPTHIPGQSRAIFGYIGEINTGDEIKYIEVEFNKEGVIKVTKLS